MSPQRLALLLASLVVGSAVGCGFTNEPDPGGFGDALDMGPPGPPPAADAGAARDAEAAPDTFQGDAPDSAPPPPADAGPPDALPEDPPDGAADAAYDAGSDAAYDAGPDAAYDAGPDGAMDGGVPERDPPIEPDAA